jgi:hypothetical protein
MRARRAEISNNLPNCQRAFDISTGSSVTSLHYRFVFVFSITIEWGLLLALIGCKGSLAYDTLVRGFLPHHFCCQDSLAQDTTRRFLES